MVAGRHAIKRWLVSQFHGIITSKLAQLQTLHFIGDLSELECTSASKNMQQIIQCDGMTGNASQYTQTMHISTHLLHTMQAVWWYVCQTVLSTISQLDRQNDSFRCFQSNQAVGVRTCLFQYITWNPIHRYYSVCCRKLTTITILILGLHPANKRRRYFVLTSPNG